MADPSTQQRRLMYGLFAAATVIAFLGVLVVWMLSYGPFG
jgi:cell division septal protein FtsQ